MASTSNVTEALRYTYGSDRVNMILNKRCIAWNLFRKKSVRAGGRGQFLIPIYYQLPEAISGITEGGAKPSTLQPATDEALFTLQEYVGNYDISWKLLSDSAGGDKYALEKALTLLDRGLRVGFCQDLSNDMLGDGRGVLALLPAADDTSPCTVSAPIRARVGMVVDIMDTDNDTVHLNSGTISAVDPINNTITVSGSISGTAASDYFVRQDTCDDSQNDSLHTNGITGIVDDGDPATVVGDYGSIDRTTAGTEYWESTVLSNSGTNRTLTEDLLLQAIHSSRLKGGGSPDIILTNPRIYRRYYQLFAAEAQQTRGAGGMTGSLGPADATMDSDTGRTPLKFSGIPIHFDDFADANLVFLLDKSTFMIAHGVNKVPQPVSTTFDRANFFVDTSNATFEVPWWWQGELVCDNPAANSKIEDISES